MKGRSILGDKVSLVHLENSDEDIEDGIHKALELIDFNIDKKVEQVAIKPNLAYYWDANTGYTTDPRVVAALIDWVREEVGEGVDIKVVEADASAMRTHLAFRTLGYNKLAEQKKVELFNLSKDTIVEKKVLVNGREIEYKVPRLLLDTDLFINVPKLKIMREVRITCAMKNMFGCIAYPRKMIYHPYLNEAVVGINKVLRPHLNVVDGIVGLGRFPIKLDLIMASVDRFSTDWVASRIMGLSPGDVPFLRISEKEKIGNSMGIEVVGEKIDTFSEIFPSEGFIATKYLWGVQLWLLNLYTKIVGDIMPPIME